MRHGGGRKYSAPRRRLEARTTFTTRISKGRRLLIRQGDGIKTYDTGDRDIQGISQAGDAGHVKFLSDRGPVDVSQFKIL